MKKDLVSIIIPNLDNFALLKNCIKSIQLRTWTLYEMIIIDNGSNNETVEYLKELEKTYKDIKVLYNSSNLGFPKACNQGIQKSEGEYIVLLNNDTEIQDQLDNKDWLQILKDKLNSSNEIKMVGPAAYNFVKIKGDPILLKLPNVNEEDKQYRINFLGFWCVIFKKDLISEIGCLDENIYPGYYDDVEYCMRLSNKGYRWSGVDELKIEHKREQTFKSISDFDNIVSKNAKYTVDKWVKILKGDIVKQEEKQTQVQIQKPIRLLGMMTIRNGEKYLKEVLDQACKFVDEIIVLNDGSTDNTMKILKQCDKVKDIIYLESHEDINWNDGINRNKLFQFAKKKNPEWFIWIDDDDVYEDRMITEVQKLMNPADSRIKAYEFNYLTFWNDKKHVRVDSAFRGLKVYKMFKNEGNNLSIPEISIHGSQIPAELRPFGFTSDICIKHYGFIEKEKRLNKYYKYLVIDPKMENQNNGYEYYVDEQYLRLVEWDEKNPEEFLRKHFKRVVIGIPTKNRPMHLAMCLQSLLSQTWTAWDLIIVDDNDDRLDEERRIMKHDPLIKMLLGQILYRGHSWVVQTGEQKGPPIAHQKVLEMVYLAGSLVGQKNNTDYILRVDDDVILESDCLEKLMIAATEDINIGAIAPICLLADWRPENQHLPYNYKNIQTFSGKVDHLDIEDDFLQMVKHYDNTLKDAEHLYSVFLYKVEAANAIGGFPKHYSQVGHREETEFTYRMYKEGWDLKIHPEAKVWHYRCPYGGIRVTNGRLNSSENWHHDESIWREIKQELEKQERKVKDLKKKI